MAQASYISLWNNNMTLGKQYRFKIYSYDSTHLHKMVIQCGDYSLVFDRVKGGVETTFTIPESWGGAMLTKTSASATLTLTTYQSNYSTQVGANSVKPTTISVPSYSLSPTISINDNDATISSKFRAFVKTKSKLSVNINAAGVYGSTIKSYKTTIDGVDYSSQSFTSNVLTTSGTLAVKSVITDSRGVTKTLTQNISVLDYQSPAIFDFKCDRADEASVLNDQGEYLYAKYKFLVADCNNLNDCNFALDYRAKDDEEWISLLTGSGYERDSVYNSSQAILNINSSYEVRLTVSDFFSTRYAYIDVSTAFTLININSNGKFLAFGKVSEKEALEIAMPVEIDGQPIQGGAITVVCDTNQSITSSDYIQCNFNSVLTLAGDNLSLESNNVVCKKKGYVEVSGMVSITEAIYSGDTFYANISRRTINAAYPVSIGMVTVATQWTLLNINPMIIEVNEGDRIFISLTNSNARGTIGNSSNLMWMNKLTVKYIG